MTQKVPFRGQFHNFLRIGLGNENENEIKISFSFPAQDLHHKPIPANNNPIWAHNNT